MAIQQDGILRDPTLSGNLALPSAVVISNKVAIAYVPSTGERGYLLKVKNKTGAPTVKGTLVSAATGTDNAFILQNSEFDTFGIVYEGGVPDGSEAWIWTPGSICQVLFKDTVGSTRGNVALGADTDGRAIDVAVPSGNPVVAEHFKEIGHVMETKAGGVNVLVLVVTHYN